MRHLVRGKRLGRDVPHRKATLQALSVALIKNHRIVTTLSKAKELRKYVEPIITRAKEDTSHNRRQVFSKLQDKEAVSHLFEEVAQKALDRPGGYTRVIKAGYRKGDGAEQAVIELVDYNDVKPEQSSSKKRTRRAGKSNKPTPVTTDSAQGDKKEEVNKKQDEVKEDPKKDLDESNDASPEVSDEEE
ncbi:50S ribosomal protein L17 [Halalkalibaculum sp. DA384]|uniref:50S ribosomal protein L17 n=1 Tax=Halalkalibaculum sp. DA384 TaxID=3373606 RepID=UPI0037543C7A